MSCHFTSVLPFKVAKYTFKKDYFVKNVCPLRKGVYSKRKEFAPLGSNFFSFRVGPFSERVWRATEQTGNHKCCPRKIMAEYMYIYIPSVSIHLKAWAQFFKVSLA